MAFFPRSKRPLISWLESPSAKMHRRNTHKKYINGPDNHDGIITHLQSDILECEVKWTLGSITMNNDSGGDEIPVELFQILTMMLLKCHT